MGTGMFLAPTAGAAPRPAPAEGGDGEGQGEATQALGVRRERAAKLARLDEAVSEAVRALKARGFESPYLRAFVVARINPLRFQQGAKAEFDATVDRMLAAAVKFDVTRIKADQVASAAGGGPAEE